MSEFEMFAIVIIALAIILHFLHKRKVFINEVNC
nr:MAG TPA: hypothetical protein [Caudoviricetes sp.]